MDKKRLIKKKLRAKLKETLYYKDSSHLHKYFRRFSVAGLRNALDKAEQYRFYKKLRNNRLDEN